MNREIWYGKKKFFIKMEIDFNLIAICVIALSAHNSANQLVPFDR
jgi:hypothetical protein